jgi:VanZ family protein
MSSDQGSMSQTSRFIRPLLEFLFPAALEGTLQLYHGYIRKAAHLTEYAVLAFLAWRAFSPRSNLIRYLLSVILAATVASIDEVNQAFLATRSGSAWDVLLDISGAIAAIAVIWLIKRRDGRTDTGRPVDSGNFV